MRTFVFTDAKSNKFWNIELQAASFTVTFGKVGTKGQTQTKAFKDGATARQEHNKLVAEKLTGKETRACTLGHLQRGGAPSALDRILGVRFGTKAVHLIEEGKFGRMVSYQQYQVGDVSIEEAVNQLRLVTRDSEIVRAARSVGICFGDS